MDIVVVGLAVYAVLGLAAYWAWRRLVVPRLRWNPHPGELRPACRHEDRRMVASMYTLSLQLDSHGTPIYRMGPNGPDW